MEKLSVIPRGTDSASVIQIIITKSIKGSGTEKDPVRNVYQYWDFDGNILFTKDTYLEDTKSVASSEVNS